MTTRSKASSYRSRQNRLISVLLSSRSTAQLSRFAAVALAMFVAGCGSSGPYGLVKIKGTVLYDDGSVIPAHRIEIKFISMEDPLDPKTFPRPGVVEVDTSTGEFSKVSTYNFDDGAIKGKHKVVIMAMNERNVPIPTIPGNYHMAQTTPLQVNTEDAPFEFKIPKPDLK